MSHYRIRQRTRSILGRLGIIAVMGLFAGNMLFTYIMTGVSSANYPGGEALMLLNQRLENVSDGMIIYHVFCCQTTNLYKF